MGQENTVFQMMTNLKMLSTHFADIAAEWKNNDILILMGDCIYYHEHVAKLLTDYNLHGKLYLLPVHYDNLAATQTSQVINDDDWLNITQAAGRVITIA